MMIASIIDTILKSTDDKISSTGLFNTMLQPMSIKSLFEV